MGTKGENAKNRIMQVAARLFTVKGYSAVTMQDICRETGLSRGGVYRYFGSTEEMFSAIILHEQDKAFADLNGAKEQGVAPAVMLTVFLRARLRAVLNTDAAFDNAVSEFAANSASGKDLLARRAASSVAVLGELIAAGCATGDFSCAAPEATAAHILWTLEGMAKHHALIPLTQAELTRQGALFSALLGAKSPIF